MIVYGTVHRVGNGITTAQIVAPDQRNADPAQLAAACLAAIDPMLAERVAPNDLLVAGAAFGAGNDPESAVLALQALGFGAVLADSAAESFVAVAEAYGLPVIIAPDLVAQLASGTSLRLDLAHGTVTDRATNQRFTVPPASPALLAAVRRALLLAGTRRMVEEEGFEG